MHINLLKSRSVVIHNIINYKHHGSESVNLTVQMKREVVNREKSTSLALLSTEPRIDRATASLVNRG